MSTVTALCEGPYIFKHMQHVSSFDAVGSGTMFDRLSARRLPTAWLVLLSYVSGVFDYRSR